MSNNTKSTESGPLVVERTINAPVALVWRALTNLEDLRRWFFELEEYEARVGFAFKFDVTHKGVNYLHRCKIVEVIPQKKLAYSWRYEGNPGDSIVIYELTPDGDKTKFKLTHSGLDTFPMTRDFDRANFDRGWNYISDSLKDIADNLHCEIFVTREVNGPRELVWEAMTNPKHVVHWWGPVGFSNTIEEMDVRPGGAWKQTMHGPDGANYPNKSIFKEVVKPEKLVYSHAGGKEGARGVHFTSTWTFEEVGPKKTRVSIRMIFTKTDDRDFVVREHNAIEGGKQTLGRLNDYLPNMGIA